MRIVSEWKDYDNEIKSLQIKQSKHEDEITNEEDQSEGINNFINSIFLFYF